MTEPTNKCTAIVKILAALIRDHRSWHSAAAKRKALAIAAKQIVELFDQWSYETTAKADERFEERMGYPRDHVVWQYVGKQCAQCKRTITVRSGFALVTEVDKLRELGGSRIVTRPDYKLLCGPCGDKKR